MSADTWSIISSIATTLGFGVVIFGTLLAGRQLREMTRARHLEAMLRIYELLTADSARMARRFIYTELTNQPDATTPREREMIERVSVQMDTLGRLVGAGLVPRDELMAGHAEVFVRAWKCLEPHVAYHRKRLGSRHAESFESLAQMAVKYLRKNGQSETVDIVKMWTPEDHEADSTKLLDGTSAQV